MIQTQLQINDKLVLFEYDLLNITNERGNLSPRGLARGWAKQLETDMKAQRRYVTEQKSKALFEVCALRQKAPWLSRGFANTLACDL